MERMSQLSSLIKSIKSGHTGPGSGSGPGRGSGKKGRRKTAPDISLQDPFTLGVLLLVLAIGFGSAYALWWRTWQLDQAREQDWYVSTAALRLRDFTARCEAFFRNRDGTSLALLTVSAGRLEGSLAQIPRRGPVDWRSDIVALAEELRAALDSALSARLAGPAAELAPLADQMPILRDRMRDLEQALGETVTRAAGKPVRTSWSAQVESGLRSAIAAARAAIADLPR